MRITKMHGIGNDYIYVNCLNETITDPSRAAKELSDRHFWVGSDGLVLILPPVNTGSVNTDSVNADFEMAMYNSDGTQAEMCGNAIRCVGKYVYDNGLTDKTELTIATRAGLKYLTLTVKDGAVQSVRVDMGAPILTPAQIPCTFDGEAAVDRPLTVGDGAWRVTCVSMGNPHAVVFVDDVDSLDLEHLGPQFEHHAAFPARINTEFIRVLAQNELQMRVWERGAGETWACGTGACAALVAAVLNGKCDRTATLHLRGGDLRIEWDGDTNHVFMTGPATKVFDAELDYE